MINFKDGALNFLDMLEIIAESSVQSMDNLDPFDLANPVSDEALVIHAGKVIRASFKSFHPKCEYDYEKLWELISGVYHRKSRGDF